MTAEPSLDLLPREELVKRARELGARRPEVMTRVELRDEIVRLSESDPAVRRRSRGWLGVARDLVASVMDAGLNMPGAAAAIRGEARAADETTGPPPVATLTLAEIYLAQGHTERALATLEEVLGAEPEHGPALALRERIENERVNGAARRRPASAEGTAPEEPVVAAPAPAPFVASPEPAFVAFPEPAFVSTEPALVAPVTGPEVTSAPEIIVPHFMEPASSLPAGDPETLDVAAPTAPQREAEATPISLAVPTLAGSDVAYGVDSALPARAACALLEQDGVVEGFYSLPPGVSGVVLRFAWVVPGRDGPSQGSLDVPLEPGGSRVSLPKVVSTARVRGALGTTVDGTFRPLAVAWVYRRSQSGLSLSFAPPGVEPEGLFARSAG